MDIRKIILGVMVIVFIVIIFVPIKITPDEKRCSADSDCAFVKTLCCPNCEGGLGSVNTKYSDKMNLDINTRCNNLTCPPLYCENPYGESYTAKPACVNNVCSSKSELNCNAICSYLEPDRKDRAPYKVYLSNDAIAEGLSQTALADKCEC